MGIPTLLREAEHRAISKLTLSGSILDLGGARGAPYLTCIQGEHTITTLNLDTKDKPDIIHDLEKPLPMQNASYDHVLLVNVLEHIFEYRQLLEEAVRVTRLGGSVVVVVPFLFPIHPSPRDYWRFTKDALTKECERAGLTVAYVETLGSGVFGARFVMFDRLLPFPLRALLWLFHPFVRFLDLLFTYVGKLLGKKYNPSDYALGYLVHANRK